MVRKESRRAGWKRKLAGYLPSNIEKQTAERNVLPLARFSLPKVA